MEGKEYSLKFTSKAEENYLVFYLVNEKKQQVIIMRILYGASNYKSIL